MFASSGSVEQMWISRWSPSN